VVTAADISKVDQRIRDAVNGTVRADGFAVNNEIDEGPRRTRVDARGDAEDKSRDAGEMVDKVLKHFDDALKMHADALTRRMDDIEEKMKRADRKRRGDEGEGEDKDKDGIKITQIDLAELR
jgi:hypothetical protein